MLGRMRGQVNETGEETGEVDGTSSGWLAKNRHHTYNPGIGSSLGGLVSNPEVIEPPPLGVVSSGVHPHYAQNPRQGF
jgi:hypothetical protein